MSFGLRDVANDCRDGCHNGRLPLHYQTSLDCRRASQDLRIIVSVKSGSRCRTEPWFSDLVVCVFSMDAAREIAAFEELVSTPADNKAVTKLTKPA